jgi:hypothetical protein
MAEIVREIRDEAGLVDTPRAIAAGPAANHVHAPTSECMNIFSNIYGVGKLWATFLHTFMIK